jgi:hypothetical protein
VPFSAARRHFHGQTVNYAWLYGTGEHVMDQPTQSVTSYESVAEAALELGHKTYSGTVAATLRRTEADETVR